MPSTALDGIGVHLDADHLEGAVAFVAATESDMTNLWLLRTAKQINPDIFLVALQNRASNARLYEAAGFRRTEGDGGPVMLAYEREL